MTRRTRWKVAGASIVVSLGAIVAVLGQPDLDARVRRLQPELDRRLRSGEVLVDPAEVVSLRHDRSVRLQILDFRPEADYNLCHIVDAMHVDAGEIGPALVRGLPVDAVKLVVSNGESAAIAAWQQLVALGTTNVYVLSGGMNLWLDIFKDGRLDAAAGAPDAETLRHSFPAALGARSPHADPDPAIVAGRRHDKVVKSLAAVLPPEGGCGG